MELGGTGGPRRALLARAGYLIVLAGLIPLLAWNGFVQQINAGLCDILLRMRAPADTPAVRQIVLLAIDDQTAGRYGPLPLPRGRLAEGLAKLAVFAPRVLVIDLLLSEPAQTVQDEELAQAVRRFPRVAVSAALASDGAARPSWILPLPVLARWATTAHVHAAPDADGVVRRVLLAKEGDGRRFWALGLEAARLTLGADRPVEAQDWLQLGSVRIPARQAEGRALAIHYAGPEGTFRRVPFSALLEGSASEEDFRDKTVILGVTAQGSGDRLFTPLSSGIGMSGIEIHAGIARTILDRAFLLPLGPGGEVLAGFVIASVCVLGVVRVRGLRLIPLFAGLAAALPAACAAALAAGRLWPLGAFLAVFLASAAVSGGSEYALAVAALGSSERKRKDYAFRVQAIAHEIKTPLTAIQGSSEMLSEDEISSAQRAEVAGLIFKESKRLTNLIHTFLDVERMAAGALTLQKQSTPLGPLCREVADRARLYAARKRIQIDLEVPDLAVPVDPELLAFALYNLLTNGVKYSPKNSSILLRVTESSDTVSISVSDQGSGIAPAEQQRVFERFYRLKRDEAGAVEGSGIGLALVKEIAEQHGGRIGVESAPGKGSRFTLALPRGES
ncbi:MAG: CHASE2 domain-containing protein [Acidobacteria bacterium]|nr:CHASE2 domain-containing protein [Acidobacteriota bacterium]